MQLPPNLSPCDGSIVLSGPEQHAQTEVAVGGGGLESWSPPPPKKIHTHKHKYLQNTAGDAADTPASAADRIFEESAKMKT